MLRRLYDWIMRLAESPRALWALALVSFAESSFFPIPPDPMLIPMVLANRRRAWAFASVATIASVVGGIAGYFIGYSLESLGQSILAFYGYRDAMGDFQAMFAEWGLWIILIKGLTPIPYKFVTIASGMAGFDLKIFILASIATRGGRFFIIATLLFFFGEPVRAFIEKRLTLVTTLFVVLLVGGFVVLKYIF
ncbi:YqaA family protein [Dongia mobilis]|uniref:YqaA family protein n=1 Tax=Dongia sp. TaxID=1977262 RepID=UPI0026EB9FD2